MLRRTNKFVCAECKELMPSPVGQNGILRCPQGHRLQGLKDRPIWLEISVSIFVSLCVSGLLIGVGNALTGNATLAAFVVSAALTAWCAFLLARGFKYRQSGGVLTALARQYLGTAVGFLVMAVLIGLGATIGLFAGNGSLTGLAATKSRTAAICSLVRRPSPERFQRQGIATSPDSP
jgi:hypothetical protein